MRTPSTRAVVVLPATSATLATVDSSPSPVRTVGAGQSPAMPESASAQSQRTTTSSRYQPPAGASPAEPVRVGAVRSTLTPSTEPVPSLPAASVAVLVADWAPPSPSVTGAAQAATPESASAQSKETVTGAENQPEAAALPSTHGVTAGAVR